MPVPLRDTLPTKVRIFGSGVDAWTPASSSYGEVTHWIRLHSDWFRLSGEPLRQLVILIDDATGYRWGRFVRGQDRSENMPVLFDYVKCFGRMRTIKSYAGSGLRILGQSGGGTFTQFGRALKELNIKHIRARARSEQFDAARAGVDRRLLVRQLREAKIKNLAEANNFLDREFWPGLNEQFAQNVRRLENAHQPLAANLDLASVLSHVESRRISDGNRFSFEGKYYEIIGLQPDAVRYNNRLRVEKRLDGSMHVLCEGRSVEFRERERRGPTSLRISLTSTGTRSRKGRNAGGKSSWMRDWWADGTGRRPAHRNAEHDQDESWRRFLDRADTRGDE